MVWKHKKLSVEQVRLLRKDVEGLKNYFLRYQLPKIAVEESESIFTFLDCIKNPKVEGQSGIKQFIASLQKLPYKPPK